MFGVDVSFFYFLITRFLCCTPQRRSSSITLFKESPYGVMEYSTVTGEVSNTVRLISWFNSSSLSSLESILAVTPSISLCISLKRFLPKMRETMMGIFHFPFRMSSESRTGFRCPWHSLLLGTTMVSFIITQKYTFWFLKGYWYPTGNQLLKYT